MKLIIDENHFTREDYLFESIECPETKAKSLYIKGPFICGCKRNLNKRIYPTELLREQIEIYDKNLIQTKRALGALEHPDTPMIDSNIASHIVTEMHQDGDVFHGVARVLCGTPKGAILKALITEGVQMGVSSRALGNVDENGIVSNLVISAFDCVSTPSCQIAFVNGILESREFICNYNDKNERIYEEFDGKLSKLPKTAITSQRDKYISDVVKAFLANLKA